MIVFGPLWSRRLGRSLGINNIPPKHCSYSCVYCQVGPTARKESTRRHFFPVDEIVRAVAERVAHCRRTGQEIDFVTFVSSGEPTLDANLGAEIRAVSELGHPVAVLTNGSLLAHPDVRADLRDADLVSVKVDTVKNSVWRRINRPASSLDLGAIRESILHFARDFRGRLLTETMIVAGFNDEISSIQSLSRFLSRVDPYRAYLATPTRPPATQVEAPSDQTMARLFTVLASHVRSAGLLLPGYPLMLSASEDALTDLVATVAVHPLSEESVTQFLNASSSDWKVVETLIERGELRRQQNGSQVFFVRGGGAGRGSHKKQLHESTGPKCGGGAA